MTEADSYLTDPGSSTSRVERFADQADVALDHAVKAEAADSQWDSLATNIRIERDESNYALRRKPGTYNEDLDVRAGRDRKQQCKDVLGG